PEHSDFAVLQFVAYGSVPPDTFQPAPGYPDFNDLFGGLGRVRKSPRGERPVDDGRFTAGHGPNLADGAVQNERVFVQDRSAPKLDEVETDRSVGRALAAKKHAHSSRPLLLTKTELENITRRVRTSEAEQRGVHRLHPHSLQP